MIWSVPGKVKRSASQSLFSLSLSHALSVRGGGEGLTAIVDRAESVRHEHTGARLLLQDRINVSEEGLLRVRIERRSLLPPSASGGRGGGRERGGQGRTHSFVKEQ